MDNERITYDDLRRKILEVAISLPVGDLGGMIPKLEELTELELIGIQNYESFTLDEKNNLRYYFDSVRRYTENRATICQARNFINRFGGEKDIIYDTPKYRGPYHNLGDLIKDTRRQLYLTQEEFGKKLGVHLRTVQN